MEEQTNTRWNKFKLFMWKHLLTYCMISSIILGFIAGIIIQRTSEGMQKSYYTHLNFIGVILIRMLKCTAVPLIVTCIIVAVTSLDLVASRAIAWQLVSLVVVMKSIATCLGLAVIVSIHPGRRTSSSNTTESFEMHRSGMIMDIFLDLFVNLIPNNMMQMFLQQYETQLSKPEGSDSDNMLKWEVGGRYIDNVNLLGMIFIAIIIGLCLNITQDMNNRFTVVSSEVYAVTMELATGILWTAPVFLFFLVMADVMVIDDFVLYFKTWGIYIITMHAVHILIIFVQYPLALFLLVRINPMRFYYDMANAIITAYVTSSSIASMPVTIDCLLKHGVDERIVRFVVPIGINLNKIGSASSLTVCLVFVAQMLGATLTAGEYFTVVVLSVLGSIVVPAVPFSGIAVIVMLLNTLGLAQNLVAGILAVEWINDRIGTTNNVLGNCVFPKIIEKWNRKLLKQMDENEALHDVAEMVNKMDKTV